MAAKAAALRLKFWRAHAYMLSVAPTVAITSTSLIAVVMFAPSKCSPSPMKYASGA